MSLFCISMSRGTQGLTQAHPPRPPGYRLQDRNNFRNLRDFCLLFLACQGDYMQ